MPLPADLDQPDEAPPLGDADDAWLVGLACAGDAHAFEQLVRKHVSWAVALADSLLSDADEAEDAVQIAFVSALKGLNSCRHPELFRCWFRTIVKRMALTYAKRGIGMKQTKLVATLPDESADADQRARLSELHAHVRDVLRVISPLQGRVFVLHDIDGYSHGEIATELGITSGSSRVHLHNARRALRAKLQPLYREESTDG